MKANRADEDMMIQCDGCKYWVHARCEGIDHEAFKKLSTSEGVLDISLTMAFMATTLS